MRSAGMEIFAGNMRENAGGMRKLRRYNAVNFKVKKLGKILDLQEKKNVKNCRHPYSVKKEISFTLYLEIMNTKNINYTIFPKI